MPTTPSNAPAAAAPRPVRAPLLLLASLAILAGTTTAGCVDQDMTKAAADALMSGPDKPDVLPKMLNTELPFRYPADLYARRVQGNVLLRIFIDSLGSVHHDSTIVLEPSGYPALDSSAVLGVQALRFTPATLKGRPMSVQIQYPVFFRHPEAAPLPGDTILQRRTGTAPPPPPSAKTP